MLATIVLCCAELCCVVQTMQRAMLPVLLKLLHLPTVLEAVPQVLTDLLQQSPAMQKAANDSNAVSSLTTLLHHEQTWHNRPRFKASHPLQAKESPHKQFLSCWLKTSQQRTF